MRTPLPNTLLRLHHDKRTTATHSRRQFGISPCLYFINAWDCWESGDSATVYVAKQLAMLTELTDGRYGQRHHCHNVYVAKQLAKLTELTDGRHGQ